MSLFNSNGTISTIETQGKPQKPKDVSKKNKNKQI